MFNPIATINLKNFRDNIKYIKSISKSSDIFPVIKANAYGHGYARIAKILNQESINTICVATYDEILEILKEDLNLNILHLGRIVLEKNVISDKVIFTINSLDDIENINKICSEINKRIRCHIKVDTGMNRMGCKMNEFNEILELAHKSDFINIEAIYSTRNIQELNFNHGIKSILKDIEINKIDGINITNPYKTNIISSMISLSDDAKKINAINCIYKKENKLIGENTDWQGFVKSLNHNNIDLQNHDIIIIGAGGVSRSIIYSFQKQGIKNFQIYNRTNINNFKINEQAYSTLGFKEFEKNIYPNSLIINCTSLDVIESLDVLSEKILENVEVFYDLNYHRTEFHSILENKDIHVIGGLDMLIYQAIKSIELWCNQEIMEKININEIKKYLKEPYIDVK